MITLSAVTLSQRSRLLIAISSSIPSFRQLPVTTNRGNNSSKRSSVQVASNQRFRLFVKVQGSLSQQQQRSSVQVASNQRFCLFVKVRGSLSQQQQKVLYSSGVKPKAKGCVSSTRSPLAFGGLSVALTIQVTSNQRLRLQFKISNVAWSPR